MEHTHSVARDEPWNKGKIVGQKAPLELKTHGRYEFAARWSAASENAPDRRSAQWPCRHRPV